MKKREAYFTHYYNAEAGHYYYFAPAARHAPPYTTQRRVEAIIDVAPDGSLAGVELIEKMPPPPRDETTPSP